MTNIGDVVVIIREDDDPLADARISIGSPRGIDNFYIVFRGDPKKVIDILGRALTIAKKALPENKYEDRRGARL